MTNEKMETGIQLHEKIKDNEKRLAAWEAAIGFKTVQIKKSNGWDECAFLEDVNFEVNKALAMTVINARLKKLREEYEAL